MVLDGVSRHESRIRVASPCSGHRIRIAADD